MPFSLLSVCLSSSGQVESANALWGGAAVRGQVFPRTDANDASEEELEAESWTRGERGPYPRILLSTWMKKNTPTVRGVLLIKLYFCRGACSPRGLYPVFDQQCARYYSIMKYLTGSTSYRVIINTYKGYR